MFKYTKNELSERAKEMNFVRDTLEKVVRLVDILEYLNTNPLTKAYLVLKGGTAINLTIFRLPRLSVDIDLDFSRNVSRERMLELRSRLCEDIKIYMSTQGYILMKSIRRIVFGKSCYVVWGIFIRERVGNTWAYGSGRRRQSGCIFMVCCMCRKERCRASYSRSGIII